MVAAFRTFPSLQDQAAMSQTKDLYIFYYFR